VLRDYAGFAAWEFARTARRDLTDTLSAVLGQALSHCRDSGPPDIARLKADDG
jgi:hypothetical protein